MKKKRNYVSPLWQGLVIDDDNPVIVIGGSMETGGIGDCFEETEMLTGQPGAEVYYIQGGKRVFVGYHQVREGAEDYDEYYDENGNWIDLFGGGYNGDFEIYVGETYDLWCEDEGFGGL